MQFRYDFGEKLDLSKFQKQVKHYSKFQSEYQIVMSHFMMVVKFVPAEQSRTHRAHMILATYDIAKDIDGNIVQKQPIYLYSDDRFREFKGVQFFTRFFHHATHLSEFELTFIDYDEIIEHICGLIKIFHKINGLKAFL